MPILHKVEQQHRGKSGFLFTEMNQLVTRNLEFSNLDFYSTLVPVLILMEISPYPVVDLFAGPGGLGEGFAAATGSKCQNPPPPRFFVLASIEKDAWAHRTLLLRHFFRNFPHGEAPEAYYRYLDGAITSAELFASHPTASRHAEESALHLTLGPKNHDRVRKIIADRLANTTFWVLVGGPPCQAYSLAGRSRMQRMDGFERDERHFLYREYLKVIGEHRPPIFVMENVKGLLSATHNGESIFRMIWRDLQNPRRALGDLKNGSPRYELHGLYCPFTLFGSAQPGDFVVRSEQHGIPQNRHRVFIVGIRSDLNIEPPQLTPEEPPTVEQTIGGLPKIRGGITGEPDTPDAWRKAILSLEKMNFESHPHAQVIRSELASLFKFAQDSLQRKENSYPVRSADTGGAIAFMHDPRVRTLIGHESRAHMPSDLRRYAFAAAFAKTQGRSPKLYDFPPALLPAHRNIVNGVVGKNFVDRFRVQLPNQQASTITAHMAKDGHYYIHYDPAQCRSLTVREAARLQTFPDNYKFEGPRTEQYRQIGNAVPPYLARQIGDVVADALDAARREL